MIIKVINVRASDRKTVSPPCSGDTALKTGAKLIYYLNNNNIFSQNKTLIKANIRPSLFKRSPARA